MAAKTRWPTIQNISASLDRFVNKGHKKYFIRAKTVWTCNRTRMSGFQSVRLSNVRDWHKIESEYRPRFVFGGLLY
jgi:hypothetical protein